jgi:outer membrane beta-barrel protein
VVVGRGLFFGGLTLSASVLGGLILGGLIFGSASNAQSRDTDPYDVPTPSAVENKLFQPSKELNVQVGFMPLDAFHKGVTLSLSYVGYSESYWGWEYLNLQGAINWETDLTSQLRNNFGAEEDGVLDYVRYTVTTNWIYTPIYNKNLIFNSKVMHGEVSFVGGGGIAGFDSQETAPMFGGGLILRFFSSETVSYKLDTRAYYHTADGKNTNFLLTINLGLAYEFDPGRAKKRRR